MNQTIINEIINKKIISIVRGVPEEKLIPLAEAMYDGGIRLMEVTYSANGAVSDEETAKYIEMLAEAFEDRMFIGAGTVMTTKQVELTKRAGGQFIISPDTNTEVIEYTKALELISIPGAMTPSEICTAYRAGADFVKLFPASVLGAEYIKAIRAPISNVRLLAVGGINLDNMEDYCRVGICGFGIGANLAKREMIENNEFENITKMTKLYVDKVNSL